VIVYIAFIVKDTNEIYKLRDRLGQANNYYNEIIDSHMSLPHLYPNFINERLKNDFHTKKGLILINVDDDDYRTWLTKCSDIAKSSFCATLTDGYLPSFFYKEDNRGNLTLKSKQNIEYLEKTNKLAVKDRTRIFIFKKNKFIDDLESLKENYLKNFLKIQNNFRLFFIDPDEIRRKLQERKYLYIKAAIYSDFAMFENSLVFRRIGDQELAYYFTKDMNNSFPNPFSQLFCSNMLQNAYFHSLDEIQKYVYENKSKKKIINKLKSLIAL